MENPNRETNQVSCSLPLVAKVTVLLGPEKNYLPVRDEKYHDAKRKTGIAEEMGCNWKYGKWNKMEKAGWDNEN